MNKYRIYFYGALAKKGQLPYGGGQVGNAKTIQLYKRLGIDMRVIPKYFTPKKKWLLPLIALSNYIFFFSKLLIGKKNDAIVHISGFYGVVIWHEWLLVCTSKLLGFVTVYEMRGGGAHEYYKDLGKMYRWCFRSTLRMADYVFSQGKENIPLIESCCSTPIYYHPNYVETKYLKKYNKTNPNEVINLVYFGRLFEQKRIDLIIFTLKEIIAQDKHATLELIGAFESLEYEHKIRDLIAEQQLTGAVMIVDKCNHEELSERLNDKHFFLFPSETPREGQSNALTEAMAFGIVPIAADIGFSRSLIDQDELVMDRFTPKQAADMVVKITDMRLWFDYSDHVYKRIHEHFSEMNQLQRLETYLRGVWSK